MNVRELPLAVSKIHGILHSVDVLDPKGSSSAGLHLPIEEAGTNQVGESTKVRSSNSWQHLTEFMLDVKISPESGTLEIPTPPKLAS